MSQGAITKYIGKLVEAERRVNQSWWCFMNTLPETNIAHENRPLAKGDSYWKPPFLGATLVSGSVLKASLLAIHLVQALEILIAPCDETSMPAAMTSYVPTPVVSLLVPLVRSVVIRLQKSEVRKFTSIL